MDQLEVDEPSLIRLQIIKQIFEVRIAMDNKRLAKNFRPRVKARFFDEWSVLGAGLVSCIS
jgi:hypothetical protein